MFSRKRTENLPVPAREEDGKKGEGRKKKKSLLRAAALGAGLLGATSGGALVLDQSNVGVEEIDLDAWYRHSVEKVRAEYELFLHDPTNEGVRGSQMSFEQFLHQRRVPTEARFQAMRRLMSEFRDPIKVYSGVRFFSRMLAVFRSQGVPSTGQYSRSSFVFDGHSIFIRKEQMQNGEERILTNEDLEILQGELAHAFQEEKGLLTLNRVWDDFMNALGNLDVHEDRERRARAQATEEEIEEAGFVPIRRGSARYRPIGLWGRISTAMHRPTPFERAYRSMYDDPLSYEGEAHQLVEQVLASRLTLYESQQLLRKEFPGLLEGFGMPVEGALTRESFPYERYVELARAIETEIETWPATRRGTDRAITAEALFEVLYLLNDFHASLEWQDDGVPLLHLTANRTQYEDLMAILTDDRSDTSPISERVAMPPVVGPLDLVYVWRERMKDASNFATRSEFFPQQLVRAQFLRVGERFTREVYEEMMETLRRDYEGIRNTMGQGERAEALMSLLSIVNDVCLFDRECEGRYGVWHERIRQPRAVEMRDGVKYEIRMQMSDAHFEALHRIFERYRNDPDVPAMPLRRR